LFALPPYFGSANIPTMVKPRRSPKCEPFVFSIVAMTASCSADVSAANDFAPTKEIWVEHKLVWESLNDALPHYARSSVGASPQRD